MDRRIFFISFLLLFGSVFVMANSQQGLEDRIIFDVEIMEGWNLLASGAWASEVLPDSQVKASDIRAIFYYSPSQREYLQIFPRPSTEIENQEYNAFVENENALEGNFQIESRASWVYSDRAGVLRFETDDVLPFTERKLSPGWNFVSITSDAGDYWMDNSFEGFCNVEGSYFWDFANKKWLPFPSYRPYDFSWDGDSIHGHGIVLKVTDDCVLGDPSGSGSLGSVPAFPTEASGEVSYQDRSKEEEIVCKTFLPASCNDKDGGLNYTEKDFVWSTHQVDAYGTITCGPKKSGVKLEDVTSSSELTYSGSGDSCCTKCDYSEDGGEGVYLREGYCDDQGVVRFEKYECPNGCQDGVCV